MPGGFQLGHSFGLLQGALLGAGVLWGLVILILWLCGLQFVAYVLDKTKRMLVARWILRVVLLFKSAPIAVFSGLMLYSAPPPVNNEPVSEAWMFFVIAVIWFAFVPTAFIFLSSLNWMIRRAIGKANLMLTRG